MSQRNFGIENITNSPNRNKSRDYMTPVCRDEISTCPTRADLTLRLNGQS